MSENDNQKVKNRKGVLLYYNFFHALENLKDEQLGRILREFVIYSETGNEPDPEDSVEYALFNFLKTWDDVDNKRYENILEKRRSAGKKGAEVRWGSREEKEGIA